MPPSATYLEDWWLSNGHGALSRLVDRNDLGLSPRDVGFAQAAQRKLRVFDNDRDLQDRLHADWHAALESQGIDFDANPRKRLKDAAHDIFKSTQDGGINNDRVLEGLGYLDATEIRRLRLLTATQLAMESSVTEDKQSQIIEELHRTASNRYRQFHMGLRACVSALPTNQDSPADISSL